METRRCAANFVEPTPTAQNVLSSIFVGFFVLSLVAIKIAFDCFCVFFGFFGC
jgi:hypothetical protein